MQKIHPMHTMLFHDTLSALIAAKSEWYRPRGVFVAVLFCNGQTIFTHLVQMAGRHHGACAHQKCVPEYTISINSV